MDLLDMYIDLNQSLNITQMEVAYLDLKCIVRALEQQPSEDCISRAKALEILGDEPENWTDTEKEIQELNDYRWFKSILEELPLVTPSYNSIKTELTPSEDCISREAIKEMLREEWTKYIPMELDINLSFVLEKISKLPSVTPSIPDVENEFDIGYNCGYADAMFDISEENDSE